MNDYLLGILALVAGTSAGLLMVLGYRALATWKVPNQSHPNGNLAILLVGARHLIGIAAAGLLTAVFIIAFVKIAGIEPGSGQSRACQFGFVVGVLIAIDRYRRQKSRRGNFSHLR